ncbi:MAG: hypothetical protein ACO3E7_08840 [Burkholderiaceae bacterium]
MNGLNCRVGDLAVTIKAELPENLGSIVRIVGFLGAKKWYGFKAPTPLWEVEAVEGCRLVYEYEGGEREYTTEGHIPDAFLKPITPRKQIEETEESEVCLAS